MTAVPTRPSIYHITHVENLPAILAADCLRSDSAMIARGGTEASIGMRTIKQRRLGLRVKCYPDSHVGDFVPFYFCPRSIMLYLIHMANHEELTYKGGQEPIVHLEADLRETVAWAESERRQWAFSLSNAGAYYTEFRKRLDQLDEINWKAVAETDFREPEIKEGKQAELLVRESFPWHLVRRIGVRSDSLRHRVASALAASRHRPPVEVQRDWYF